MEALTKQICIRVSESEMEILRKQAEEQRRSVSWIARETMKKGLDQN